MTRTRGGEASGEFDGDFDAAFDGDQNTPEDEAEMEEEISEVAAPWRTAKPKSQPLTGQSEDGGMGRDDGT